ncbi:MAG: hypothetical protein ACK5PP_08610 [Acidimicrobiales bacterium]
MTATSTPDDGAPDQGEGCSPDGVSVEGVFRRRGLVARHHPLTVVVEVAGSSFTADNPLPAALLAMADAIGDHPEPDFAVAAEALQAFVVDNRPTGVAAVLDGPEPILFLLDIAFATEPADTTPVPDDRADTADAEPIDGIVPLAASGPAGPGPAAAGPLDGPPVGAGVADPESSGRSSGSALLPIEHRGVEASGWVTIRLSRRTVELEVGGLGSDPTGIILRDGVMPGTRAVVTLTRRAADRRRALSPAPGPAPASAAAPPLTPEPPTPAPRPDTPETPGAPASLHRPTPPSPDLSHLPPPPSASIETGGPPSPPGRAAPPPGPGGATGGSPLAPPPAAPAPTGAPAAAPHPPTGVPGGARPSRVGTLFDLERGTRVPVAGPVLIGADPRRAAADDPGATVIIVGDPGVGEVQVRITTDGTTAVAQNIGGGATWVQNPGAPAHPLEGRGALADGAQIRVGNRIFGYRSAGPSPAG